LHFDSASKLTKHSTGRYAAAIGPEAANNDLISFDFNLPRARNYDLQLVYYGISFAVFRCVIAKDLVELL
jgi:hypothetical protein